MWRCEDAFVRNWPAQQLEDTLVQLRAPRLADRRSAGLPFLVQVTTTTMMRAALLVVSTIGSTLRYYDYGLN